MPFGAFRLNSLGRFTAPVVRTAKTVTAVGNAQVDTAQSKFGGASALFDGTSDYLTVSAGGFNVGTGDITLEAWVRHNAINDQQVYFDTRGPGNGLLFYVQSDNKLVVYDGLSTYTSTATMAANTWYHLAVSRSGSSLKVYRDGVEVISGTNSRNLSDNGTITIGTTYEGFSTNSMNGWMDEIRISNSARYTAGFTPSTTAFTNDSNTLLLLHCNGTDATTVFTDDVGTNFIPRTPRTITVGGNAKISTAQNKFGGASGLYDGTSDYISVPGFSDLAFGTGDFTLEAFVRQSARSDQMVIFDTRNSGNTAGGFILYMRADNYMELYWNSAYVSSANPLPTVDTWYHVAVSRSGSALKVFVDGTSVISVTDSQNHSAAGPFIVGQDFQLTSTPGNSWNGYIDEVRFSSTARYTANFTAPTVAFINDRDTLLLLHCDGTNNATTFTDDNGVRSQKGISAFGNAQVDTAQSKFGSASYLGDGTGDGLDIWTLTDFGFGTGAFTVECWVRFASTSGTPTLWDTRPAGAGQAGLSPYLSSAKLRIYTNTTGNDIIIGSTTLSANTWYHIAVSRDSSNNLKLFVNGTQDGSTYTTSIDLGSNRPMRIGQNIDNNACLNGHIDEFRVSNTARYTANFTAPTTAFTNDSNTVLLIHAEGADASTTFTDDNA